MEHANQEWVAVIGTLAAACTTLAFVPQINKIRRQGGRDLSYGLLGIYLVGLLLWLGYGLLIGAQAVIAANVASAVLVGTAIVLKVRSETLPTAEPSSARRLRIAIDMDDVIADVQAKEQRGCEIQAPGFFADLGVADGSREVVRELAERHEVFIASAAMEVPTSFADKYAWLRRHFAFIPPSHYIFCGDKSVLDSDVLIDDTPRHFERFRGRAILFSAPHNQAERRYERVGSWAEVRRLLLSAPPSRAEEGRPSV